MFCNGSMIALSLLTLLPRYFFYVNKGNQKKKGGWENKIKIKNRVKVLFDNTITRVNALFNNTIDVFCSQILILNNVN